MIKIIKLNYFTILVLSIFSLIACSSDNDNDDEKMGNWINRSIFDGKPRSGSSAFTIEGKGYMVVGYDGDDYLNDFWAYDIDGDYWSQKANFPGPLEVPGLVLL